LDKSLLFGEAELMETLQDTLSKIFYRRRFSSLLFGEAELMETLFHPSSSDLFASLLFGEAELMETYPMLRIVKLKDY
jgi:hypothetical protein